MNPFWTCELYDYIQRQKELFIYAIDRDTNRPIQIDAEQDLDYFEDYDNLTIFIEEKGKGHIVNIEKLTLYLKLSLIIYFSSLFFFLQSGRIRLIFYSKLRRRFLTVKPVTHSSNSF